MHPRNLYATKKPDFANLSKIHQFLTPFVTTVNGKARVDFKNKDALRALSRALLLDDFNLDVIIPPDSLVPMIPQRLNYVLWIEDIFKKSSDLRGVDIGTGGSGIYVLLCARKNAWKMVGTDRVAELLDFANKNIERNKLTELIQTQLTANSFFAELIGKFDFSMCNPPFFSSDQEADSLGKSRTLTRPSPSAAKTGTPSELVTPGGEIQYIRDMITESKLFPNLVGIYTTLVGIKADLKFLVNFLQSNKALAYTTTSFVQGKTMRWGLAWTFDPSYVDLLKQSPPPPKTYAPVKYQLPCNCSPRDFILTIKNLLMELQFQFIINTDDKVEVIGQTNTWSNQRRKRRAAARSDNDQSPGKKFKTAEETASVVSSAISCPTVQNDVEGKSFVIHCQLTWDEKELVGKSKGFDALFLGGTGGIDSLRQVLQYFRNWFTKHTCSSLQERLEILEQEQKQNGNYPKNGIISGLKKNEDQAIVQNCEIPLRNKDCVLYTQHPPSLKAAY